MPASCNNFNNVSSGSTYRSLVTSSKIRFSFPLTRIKIELVPSAPFLPVASKSHALNLPTSLSYSSWSCFARSALSLAGEVSPNDRIGEYSSLREKTKMKSGLGSILEAIAIHCCRCDSGRSRKGEDKKLRDTKNVLEMTTWQERDFVASRAFRAQTLFVAADHSNRALTARSRNFWTELPRSEFG